MSGAAGLRLARQQTIGRGLPIFPVTPVSKTRIPHLAHLPEISADSTHLRSAQPLARTTHLLRDRTPRMQGVGEGASVFVCRGEGVCFFFYTYWTFLQLSPTLVLSHHPARVLGGIFLNRGECPGSSKHKDWEGTSKWELEFPSEQRGQPPHFTENNETLGVVL